MSKNIFITAKDIQRITDCKSLNTALREYNTIRDSLGKKNHQKLSITEYCQYHGISKDDVLNALKEK